ncbi:MAG: (Fe-S)-binding protein [Candidatus Lokiarchaeota archaeon]|nr:(Fe-S)-binding protein [Candidatus Lokiarchaeota archaeon]
MEYDDCVRCGFKCSSICTVTRGTRKYDLREFLERHLGNGEALAWPCTGCHACDVVCPAEFKPHQLVQRAMGGFLRTHENALSDYHVEFKERGRIGVNGVDLDDLVLPTRAACKHSFLQAFDKVIIFPGCLISARFPWLVHRAYQLLVLLGVDARRVIVEDEACCGSFLRSIDDGELLDNGRRVFKTMLKRGERTLLLTLCGSCTSTLRDLQRLLAADGPQEKAIGSPGSTTIQHYAELIASPESARLLRPLVEGLASSKNGSVKERVYVQFPCQAITDAAERQKAVEGLRSIMGAAGFEVARVSRDLGCCGAGLLETHPDLAIEYGIQRMANLTGDSEAGVDTIAVACGNCHRIFVDFKPSMGVESDVVEDIDVGVSFLLDMLMGSILPSNA